MDLARYIRELTHDVKIYNKAKAYEGYTLFAPIMEVLPG